MTRVTALLAIYGLLFLMLGDLLASTFIGWSAIFTVAGMLLVTLCICRMVMDRLGL